jgi:hypothetical protein
MGDKPLGTSMDEWIPSTTSETAVSNNQSNLELKVIPTNQNQDNNNSKYFIAPEIINVETAATATAPTTKKSLGLYTLSVDFWLSDHWLLQYVIGNAPKWGSYHNRFDYATNLFAYIIMELPRFIIVNLRGSGQVVFMNNPWSGLSIIIGLYIQSKWICFMGNNNMREREKKKHTRSYVL